LTFKNKHDHVLGRKLVTVEVQNRQSKKAVDEGYAPGYMPDLGLEVMPFRRNPRSGMYVGRLHYTLHPKVDDEWIRKEKAGIPRAFWERDYELQYNALGGALIFDQYDRRVHLVEPFVLPDTWFRMRFIDYGRRNPTCCLWIALDFDGNAYIYREWYHPSFIDMQKGQAAHVRRYTLPQHCFHIRLLSGHLPQGGRPEEYIDTVIDPQAGEENFGNAGSAIKTVLHQMSEHGVPCSKGSKAQQGIDTIYERLRLRTLFLFKGECPNTEMELSNYRWADFTEATQLQRNRKEAPVKRDDHAMNCLKFFGNHAIQTSLRYRPPKILNMPVREFVPDKVLMSRDIKRAHLQAEKRQRQGASRRVLSSFPSGGLR